MCGQFECIKLTSNIHLVPLAHYLSILFQMAEKAVTRSQTKGGQHGGPQLFPIPRSIKGEALAAGSEEAQKEFLNIMGFTVANIPMEEVDVFTDDEAEEITVALSHFQCNDETLIDPYFTPNEWERCSEGFATCKGPVGFVPVTKSQVCSTFVVLVIFCSVKC